jgi:hypothetical protein
VQALLDSGASPGLVDARGVDAQAAAQQAQDAALLELLARYAPVGGPSTEAPAAEALPLGGTAGL